MAPKIDTHSTLARSMLTASFRANPTMADTHRQRQPPNTCITSRRQHYIRRRDNPSIKLEK
eukprot:scaffold22388_cov43-Cyclotella_meneghiniana.AAC.2